VLSALIFLVTALWNIASAATVTAYPSLCQSVNAGGQNWTNTNNAVSPGNGRASSQTAGNATDYLQCTNFGFALPANAIINGITLDISRRSNRTSNGGSNDFAVRLVKAGAIGTADRSTTTIYTTIDVTEAHGGATDLWGDTWTPADINNANFGMAFRAIKPSNNGASHLIEVDFVQITVDYTLANVILTANGQTGTATATVGVPVQMDATAYSCPAPATIVQWRDTWYIDGVQQSSTSSSSTTCTRSPITQNYTFAATGTYSVMFNTEYRSCNLQLLGICLLWSGWTQHGQDTVTIQVNPAAACDTFSDTFSAVSYANNNGTANWTGNWLETGDDGAPGSGLIQVNTNQLHFIGGGGTPSVEREADLSPYTSATLSFDFTRSNNWENNDNFDAYASSDGGATWVLLQNFRRNSPSPQNFSVDVTGYISANFRLKFVHGTSRSNEIVDIDNVQIQACTGVPGASLAEYHLDETSWGVVADTSGNGNNGSTVGTVTAALAMPAIPADPGTCGYADIPNDSTNTSNAVDSGIDVDSRVGNQGTISFWYKSNIAWNGGTDRELFDATNSVSRDYFYLVLRGDGRLRFSLLDNAGNRQRVQTNNLTYAANTWKHIAVTWDMTVGVMQIYIDGVLNTSRNVSTRPLGNMDTLYFGDNRSNYFADRSTRNSANGSLDEIRIYSQVRNATQILADMNTTHACGAAGVHHYRILHDGSALTCSPESVTIQACQTADCSVLYSGAVTATLNPTGWIGGDNVNFTGGSLTAQLRHTAVGTVTLGVAGATPIPATPTDCFVSGVAGSCDIVFHNSGFIFDVPNLTSCQSSAAVTISAVNMDTTTEQCVPAFSNRTENIKFWSTYTNPLTGTRNVSVNGTAVAAAGPGTDVPLNFDANGQSTITVNYPDAGQMQLTAAFTGAGAEAGLVMTGNDPFIAVPAQFYVYSGDTNAGCASGDATCTAFKKAGETFNLNVRAACADNTATPNFIANGITIGHNLVAPAAGSAGALGTGAANIAAADNGDAMISQSVDEVGVFTFTAALDNYLGLTPVAPGTHLIEGVSANIGRFIPARFVVNGNTPAFIDACTAGATPFTYMGQDPVNGGLGFTADPVITVMPQNTAGSFTRNYGGTFWKLSNALAGRSYQKNPAATTTANVNLTINGGAATLGGTAFDTTPETLTISGDRLTYDRPVNPEAPFNASVDLVLSAADLTDSDGVCLDPANAACNTNDGNTPNSFTIAGITGAQLRYGQGYTRDVYGAVADALIVPIRALYFDGANWITHADDQCSVIPYTKADTGITSNVTPASPVTLANGNVDLTVTVVTDPGDEGGNTVITPTWPAWLPGVPATGTATFGLFRGDDSYLYWNENK